MKTIYDNTTSIFSDIKIGPLIEELFDVVKLSDKEWESGMGMVYACRVKGTKEFNLALKTYRKDINRDLFRKEALFGLKLGMHPNVVYAGAAYEENGRFYLLMNLVGNPPADYTQKLTGNTLEDFMNLTPEAQKMRLKEFAQNAKENDPLKQIVSGEQALHKVYLYWLLQICDGLAYCYQNGMKAHRDLKPDNILIDKDGTVKIFDFGLAVQTQQHFGVAEYAAPELRLNREQEPNEQSDIYALGVIGYQLFNRGYHPAIHTLNGSSGQGKITPLPVSQFYPDIIETCCHADRRIRYKNVTALRNALEKELGITVPVPSEAQIAPELYALKAEGFFNLTDYSNALVYLNKAEQAGLDLEVNQLFTRAISYYELHDYRNLYLATYKLKDKLAYSSTSLTPEMRQILEGFIYFFLGRPLMDLTGSDCDSFEEESGLSPYEAAVDDFTKAIACIDYPLFYFWRGKSYLKLKKPEEAVKDFYEAERRGAVSPELYFLRATGQFYLLKQQVFLRDSLNDELNAKAKRSEVIVDLARKVIADFERVPVEEISPVVINHSVAYAYHIIAQSQPKNTPEYKINKAFIKQNIELALDGFEVYVSHAGDGIRGQITEQVFMLGQLCVRYNFKSLGIRAFKTVLKTAPDYLTKIELYCDKHNKSSWADLLVHFSDRHK